MSVRRAQEEVGSAEFGEWLAFGRLEPFGGRVDDLRAGAVLAMIHNANRGDRSPAARPKDYMMASDAGEIGRQSAADMKAALEGALNLAASVNQANKG